MVKEWWDGLEKWQKRLGIVAALIAALVALGGYVRAASDAVHWQSEADADKAAIEQHHDNDVQMILEEIAAQKKIDRIGRNHRELARLQRDLVGGNYSNDDEREFMKMEIERLGKAIACDERGECQ